MDKRHADLAPLSGVDDGPGLIVTRRRDCPADHFIDWHRHQRAQLLYAVNGVMQVTAPAGIWIVPPQRAVWIPPGTPHHVRAQGGPLSLRSVYVHPDVPGLPETCSVVTVSPLMRELILEAMDIGDGFDPTGPEGRLVQVLLDRIRELPVAPLHLPMVADPRLKRIADTLLAEPDDPRTLDDWAALAGASARTLARAFIADTGMTFGQWRQQARLLAALARLAQGDSVTTVALDLGYASQSAFIAMFRRALGRTPGRYFAEG
ncbi:MAG: helix-turn-helix transcriptional regulator [Proteobacteria bacterium]|nr:helix-turn-helix transcriptional regulator [Pseudomonadota bacterium]